MIVNHTSTFKVTTCSNSWTQTENSQSAPISESIDILKLNHESQIKNVSHMGLNPAHYSLHILVNLQYYSCKEGAGVPTWFPEYSTTCVTAYTTHRSAVQVQYMQFEP